MVWVQEISKKHSAHTPHTARKALQRCHQPTRPSIESRSMPGTGSCPALRGGIHSAEVSTPASSGLAAASASAWAGGRGRCRPGGATAMAAACGGRPREAEGGWVSKGRGEEGERAGSRSKVHAPGVFYSASRSGIESLLTALRRARSKEEGFLGDFSGWQWRG